MESIVKTLATDGDYYEFTADVNHTDGESYRVQLHKHGGGTVGKAYGGEWSYRVFNIETGQSIGAGDGFNTPEAAPKTHEQAAAILLEFLAE